MAFEHWDKTDDGRVAVNPLTGWDTARFGPLALLRLQYASSDAELLQRSGRFLPLQMSAAQARELAQALIALAETIERPDPGQRGH